MPAIRTLTLSNRTFLLAICLLVGACARHAPDTRLPVASAHPGIEIVEDRPGESAVRLTLLTYNIAGLPWPQRSGTRTAMARIEAAWADEFADQQPDIVVFQEAFVPAATSLPQRLGYAHTVRGPRRRDRTAAVLEPASREFLRARRIRKGEKIGAVVGSGLLLATDHGVLSNVTHPFGRQSCAGYDCLANKGAQLVEIAIPGVPEPVFVLNTHLNSNRASGVVDEQAFYAYLRQLREIEVVLDRDWRGRGPLIVAGDFNARRHLDRFSEADERILGELVHRFCIRRPDICEVTMSWDNDEPWMDTQDLQGFRDGRLVSVTPVGIRARFDSPREGRMLSDHDGLEVTWELRWRR